jgi:hypothetical protein
LGVPWTACPCEILRLAICEATILAFGFTYSENV